MLLALALSVVIGITLGMLGGGGSILTVPILLYVVHLEPREAIATSLFVVAVTSVAALFSHARAGRVRYRTGLFFGLAGMAGAYVGGRLSSYLPARMLLVLFALVMLGAAFAMLRGRSRGSEADAVSELPIAKVLRDGLLVGLLTGTVGAGGGFLVVPALALVGGMPMPQAVGTSLLVIGMNSVAGLVGYLQHVQLDWKLASSVAAASVGGSFLGSWFAGRVPQARLRQAFGIFVLLMATFLLFKQLTA